MKVLIFLRQTERRQANWKIDTISVVQELKNNMDGDCGYSLFINHYSLIWFPNKILHLINSIILSYLIISFTTKSLILAQDER